MSRVGVIADGQNGIRRASSVVFVFLLSALTSISSGCGSSNATTTTAPPQPNYPSVPAVPITWTPSSSPLPAPPAQVPPPTPSNDFPLSVSSPTDGTTGTSPLHVVASA